MLVKYLIIYLFDTASVVPFNQLLVCSMHINIGQLLICSMHIIVEIDWHFYVNFLLVYQWLGLVTPGDKNQDARLSHLVIFEYQAQNQNQIRYTRYGCPTVDNVPDCQGNFGSEELTQVCGQRLSRLLAGLGKSLLLIDVPREPLLKKLLNLHSCPGIKC